MVLTILLAWLALAAIAALFVYCCSVVSNGARRELVDDDFAAEPRRPHDRDIRASPAWTMPTAYEHRFERPGQ